MLKPTVAVVSFPGNNCEMESLRAVREAGMEAVLFRWNDDRARLADVDGYFLPGGFSYEDRGRSGMVAARDPLFALLHEEAERGKAVIGNCNGAQMLVESGLIPLDRGLRMALAHNTETSSEGIQKAGFLCKWIWITPSCARDRCATSGWEGVMHIPIAHGEGRFTTRDPDVIPELRKNGQIAFSYCDAQGRVSEHAPVTPNGSMHAIAGICNLAGNVVALMPHPERTPNGRPYFDALRRWIERGRVGHRESPVASVQSWTIAEEPSHPVELFIDTVITNNEERTVEAAAKRVAPSIRLKQLRYVPLHGEPFAYLTHVRHFNPNKEIAYVRRAGALTRWNSTRKSEEPVADASFLEGIRLLRRDEPHESTADPAVCTVITGIDDAAFRSNALREIFANPHASRLWTLR